MRPAVTVIFAIASPSRPRKIQPRGRRGLPAAVQRAAGSVMALNSSRPAALYTISVPLRMVGSPELPGAGGTIRIAGGSGRDNARKRMLRRGRSGCAPLLSRNVRALVRIVTHASVVEVVAGVPGRVVVV